MSTGINIYDLVAQLMYNLEVYKPECCDDLLTDARDDILYISISQCHFLILRGRSQYCENICFYRNDYINHDIMTGDGIDKFANDDYNSPDYHLQLFDFDIGQFVNEEFEESFQGSMECLAKLIAQSVEGFVPLPQLSYELK